MDFSVYNFDRSVARRAPTPWWVYVLVALLVGLLIAGGISLAMYLLEKNKADEVLVEAEMVEDLDQPSAAPEKQPEPVAAPVRPPERTSVSAPATPIPAVSTQPATTSAPPAGDLLGRAAAAKAADDLITARALALQVWNNPPSPVAKKEAEALLNEVGIVLVMSGRAMPEKIDYTVAPGDSIDKLAKKFGTTVELIRAINNIRGHIIRVGDRLRIMNATFSVKVSKSRNDLELYLNDQFLKRYPVGTGEFNKTPVGDFEINDRIAQPTWWRPDGKAIPYGDPENLLGTHWLSINVRGYGLHGTWEPETIGHQLSAGCVRMLNEDIEQLFTLLPIGTPVSIRD